MRICILNFGNYKAILFWHVSGERETPMPERCTAVAFCARCNEAKA